MTPIRSASYRTVEGDVLDEIALRRYRVTRGATEAILQANPHLRGQDAVLPAGLVVTLPSYTPRAERDPVRLWD